MCVCTPEIRTPWCGKPGCEMPPLTVAGDERDPSPALRAIQEKMDIWEESFGGHLSRLRGETIPIATDASIPPAVCLSKAFVTELSGRLQVLPEPELLPPGTAAALVSIAHETSHPGIREMALEVLRLHLKYPEPLVAIPPRGES